MIVFNKFLMQEHRFPFSICLVAMHMLTSFVFSLLLVLVCPSLYPTAGPLLSGKMVRQTEEGAAGAAATPDRQDTNNKQNKGGVCRVLGPFLPIAMFASISLVAGNEAYRYSSVAFLQMMKEAQVVVVYLLGLLVGLERTFSARHFCTLAFVACSATIAVYGEVHFRMIGFLLQAGAGLAEAVKVTVANLVMTKGNKVDPMSLVLFATPVTFLCLLPSLLWLWDPRIPDRLLEWWPYLAVNCCLAFCLNLTIATTLRT